MSEIFRTNYFIAKKGQGGALAEAFDPIIQTILGCEGCVSCELFQSSDNEDLVLVFEQWTSKEKHQAAAKHVRPSDFQNVMAFLAEKPEGNYFTKVA